MQAIDVAIDAAHRAGSHIREHFGRPQRTEMKSPTEIVTQVDRDAEQIIVRTIREAFPGDDFLGEEGHTPQEGAERVWVIDPLDGTRNYALGIPIFCVSIALAVRGHMALGVIYDPLRNETFSAELGGGAFLNGVPVRQLQRKGLNEAVVCVGMVPAQSEDNPELALPMLVQMRHVVAAMRNLGSAALGLAYVASGRIDVSYQDRLSAWDMLAGALLVNEAGGVATDFHGEPIVLSSDSIIAALDPDFHRVVLEIAQDVGRLRDVATAPGAVGVPQPGLD